MDWQLIRGTGRPGPRRVPNHYFGDYFSTGFSAAPEDAWVTGRFSPIDEQILYIGSDTGHICVVNVDAAPGDDAAAFKHYFRAHPGVVMDIQPVPGSSTELLTMSGADIRIWTLGEPVRSTLFLGHEKSVRAACFAPDDKNVFATGGRDGCILMWDRRLAPLAQNGAAYRRPHRVHRNAHTIRPVVPNPAVGGGRRRSERSAPPPRAAPSITAMTYLDEHTIVTSSEAGKSGIRLWDVRANLVRDEARPLAVLDVPSASISRDVGVTSICLDRFKSSLFAVATDNCIHEYHPLAGRTEPVRSYVGACVDADYYIQIAASPISDHILCGSGDKRALVWDCQKFHAYADQPLAGPASTAQKGIRPVLSLGGHDKKVAAVGFSANAAYMLSMDDRDFRIWRHMPASRSTIKDAQDNFGAAFERVETMEVPREEQATAVLERFSITPGPRLFLSPTKAGMAPLQKRKEPFASTSFAPVRLFSNEKENIPPGLKRGKLDGVSDEEELKARAEEERRRKEERRRNPFYYKHPTMHLPNLVYERYVAAQLRGGDGDNDGEGGGGRTTRRVVETETITKSGRKVRTIDCWRRSSAGRLSKESKSLPTIDEFRGSACAAMLPMTVTSSSATTTTSMTSPRKLLVVRQQQPSAAAAAAAATNGRRSSVRNILHYFQANRTTDEE